jgi:drug/metabolite transporter (DMT)-like permease
MDVGTILLIVIGAVLLIALIALLGGGMAMGGMAMMAGMMSNPLGWLILLILVGVIALIGYILFFQGNQQASAQVLAMLSALSTIGG